MKSLISTLLLGCSIAIVSCQKEDQSNLQEIQSKKAAVNATINNATVGDDVVTTSGHQLELSLQQENDGGDWDYINPINLSDNSLVTYYLGKFEAQASYHIRNLKIMVIIPYQYDFSSVKGIVYKISAPRPGVADPRVSFIGKQGEIVNAYAAGGMTPGIAATMSDRMTAQGNAIFYADERRTITTTNLGNVKITAGFNTGPAAIGTEIDNGQTVTQVENENGVHTGEVYFTIACNASGWTNTYKPIFTYDWNLNAAFHGTLQD